MSNKLLNIFLMIFIFAIINCKKQKSDDNTSLVALLFASNTSSSSLSPFSLTGSMNVSRYKHTATVLSNGKVLITGGISSSTSALSSAEIYDPATGVFTNTGTMISARANHTATLLSNGKVLITGGQIDSNSQSYLFSTELYDPNTGAFTASGNINGRSLHTATLLSNGKVLLVGGQTGGGFISGSSELYDPSTGISSTSGTTVGSVELSGHTANLLSNGKVLVAGMKNSQAISMLYDVSIGTFSATGSLTTPRAYHLAQTLSNGKVLIIGGINASNQGIATAELYDPTTGIFTNTASFSYASQYNSAVTLPSGNILVVGGYVETAVNVNTVSTNYTMAVELYDISKGTVTTVGNLNVGRSNFQAVLLQNNKVLIVGGSNKSGVTNSAELYSP